MCRHLGERSPTFSHFRDLFCAEGPLLPCALPHSAQDFVFDDRSHGSEEPSSNQKLQVEFSDIPALVSLTGRLSFICLCSIEKVTN